MPIISIIITFLLAALLVFTGAFFKLESWPYASEMLVAGWAFGVLGIILLILRVVRSKG